MHLLVALAHAASLDQLEVGGPFGTPTDTGATAVWWSPASLAGAEGLRAHVEVAVMDAEMRYTRLEPNGGEDVYLERGVLPYAGVGWGKDLGRAGTLGLGGALVVPNVRGGTSTVENGPGRWAMEKGRIQAIYGLGAVAWSPHPVFGVGLVGGVIDSAWTARSDKDPMPDLGHAIEREGGTNTYTDDMLETDEYAVQLDFKLKDTSPTGGFGFWVAPHERVRLSATYVHGARVDNTGPVTMAFSCPLQSDTVGRFAAEKQGLCDADVLGTATVSYRLPPRVHGGVSVMATEKLRLEAMGGWVGWSRYDDFQIGITDPSSSNTELSEEAIHSMTEAHPWARDNEDAVWGALDVKGRPIRMLTVGGRVAYDSAAVPDHALSPNNYDADTWMLSGLVAAHPGRWTLGLSYTHFLAEDRTVEGGAFYNSIESPPDYRWNYSHSNGTYEGDIKRVALVARYGG